MKLIAIFLVVFCPSLLFSQRSCNNWLFTASLPSYAEVGEIDIPGQIPATGSLFQNNWKTRIGYYEPGAVNTNFTGYNISEVRKWNVARTLAQIKAYMIR